MLINADAILLGARLGRYSFFLNKDCSNYAKEEDLSNDILKTLQKKI